MTPRSSEAGGGPARDPGCAQVEVALGALVLGALDPDERHRVEAHVARCPACRTCLAELAPLPGLLNRLTASEAAAGLPPAPPALLDAALARAGAARRSRRRARAVLAVAVAAVTVLLVAVGATVLADRPSGGRGPGVAVPTAGSVPATGAPGRTTPDQSVIWDGDSTGGTVRATVLVSDQRPGSRLALTLTGVPSGQRCDLVIESSDGRREVSATWQATYEGAASVTGSTATPPSRITRMLVATPDGATLVELHPAG